MATAVAHVVVAHRQHPDAAVGAARQRLPAEHRLLADPRRPGGRVVDARRHAERPPTSATSTSSPIIKHSFPCRPRHHPDLAGRNDRHAHHRQRGRQRQRLRRHPLERQRQPERPGASTCTIRGLASDHRRSPTSSWPRRSCRRKLSARSTARSPNGTWTLHVSDDSAVDGGRWTAGRWRSPPARSSTRCTPCRRPRLMDTRVGATTVDSMAVGEAPSSGGKLVELRRHRARRRAVERPPAPWPSTSPSPSRPATRSSPCIRRAPSGPPRRTSTSPPARPCRTWCIVALGANGTIALFNNNGSAARHRRPARLVAGHDRRSARSRRPACSRPAAGSTTVDGLFNGAGAARPGGHRRRPGRRARRRAGHRRRVRGAQRHRHRGHGGRRSSPPTRRAFRRPTASNLNVAPGETVANMVLVPVGADGKVSIYNNAGATHVVVDVLGWFPTGAPFTGLTPARLLDTREPGGSRTAARSGVDARPDRRRPRRRARHRRRRSRPQRDGHRPDRGVVPHRLPDRTRPRPTASNLNVVPGQTVPNMVIVPLGAGGQISLYNNAGSTHLVVDVLGWFPAHRLAAASPMGRDVGSVERSGEGGQGVVEHRRPRFVPLDARPARAGAVRRTGCSSTMPSQASSAAGRQGRAAAAACAAGTRTATPRVVVAHLETATRARADDGARAAGAEVEAAPRSEEAGLRHESVGELGHHRDRVLARVVPIRTAAVEPQLASDRHERPDHVAACRQGRPTPPPRTAAGGCPGPAASAARVGRRCRAPRPGARTTGRGRAARIAHARDEHVDHRGQQPALAAAVARVVHGLLRASRSRRG